MFEPQWTALADRARFVVPDLRGFGRQRRRRRAERDGEPWRTTCSRLLDHLGIDSAVVGGVSMGGYVSLALLRNDPARVRALVLADTQTSADDAAGRETPGDDRPGGRWPSGSTALLPGVDRAARPVRLAGAPGPGRRAGSPATLPRARRRRCAGHGAPPRRPRHPRPVRRAGPGAWWAAEDVLTPPAKARAMAELVPGSELVEIPGAGHLSNLEQPEAFNAALGRLPGPGAPPPAG